MSSISRRTSALVSSASDMGLQSSGPGSAREGQILMHRSNSRGSFSDSSGHPLHIPGSHIAGGEHAGQAGLQRQRQPVDGGPLRAELVAGEVVVGADEPMIVQ